MALFHWNSYAKPTPANKNKAKLSILERMGVRRASDIPKGKGTQWLWHPYIPVGHLVMIYGFGGIGKSHITALLGSTVSTGTLFPWQDEETIREPQMAIMISTEDDAEEQIRPRLIAAGADMHKVFVGDKPFKLTPQGFKDLEELIIATGAILVTLDPWVSIAGANIDMNKANEVRGLLEKLEALAKKHHCTIAVVAHSKKPVKGLDNMHALSGTVDMTNAARSTIIMYKEQGKTFFQQMKNNYGPLGPAIEYKIEPFDGSSRLVFGEVVDLESGLDKPTGAKEAEALMFIRTILRNGPVLATEVEAEAIKAGIVIKTLKRAKLGGKTGRPIADSVQTWEDGKPVWRWKLRTQKDKKTGSEGHEK
ncbi:AAA family ATPase [Phyllobacterium sp. P5_D12]